MDKKEINNDTEEFKIENYKLEEIKYAGFGVRVLAHLIDTVILVIGIIGISFMLGFLVGVFSIDPQKNMLTQNLQIFSNILSLFIVAIIIHLWVKYGKTPGKHYLGIEIVDENTFKRITLAKSLLRYFGYFLSTITLGIGYLMVLFTKKKQGLHDFLGNTVVIYSKSLIKK